jgi:hypothetical protein
MIDSRIADCSGLMSGCIRAGAGVLVLRNSTLSNCSAPEGPYIQVEAAATFRSQLLVLEPSCEADPSTALIGVASAVAAPLNVSGLQVLPPPACASTQLNVSVFSDPVRPLKCSDGDHVCGGAASCIDVQPLPASPALTTVSCSCQAPFFGNPIASSEALAPYGFDPRILGLSDPTTIGLPEESIDYCVRWHWLELTRIAAFCFSYAPKLRCLAGYTACGFRGLSERLRRGAEAPTLQDDELGHCDTEPHTQH